MVEKTLLFDPSAASPGRIFKAPPIEKEHFRIASDHSAGEILVPGQVSAVSAAEQALLSARQQAEALLTHAEAQAQEILQTAREEAAQIISEAQEKVLVMEQNAFKQGIQAGEAEGKKALLEVVNHFQAVMQAGLKERSQILERLEGEVIDLVLAIGRKILQTESKIQPEVLIKVVRHALKQLGQVVDVYIHIHPEDLPILHASLEQIQDLALEIVLEPDPSIDPGSCLIKSQAGSIEAFLEQEFQKIVESFQRVVAHEEIV